MNIHGFYIGANIRKSLQGNIKIALKKALKRIAFRAFTYFPGRQSGFLIQDSHRIRSDHQFLISRNDNHLHL